MVDTGMSQILSFTNGCYQPLAPMGPFCNHIFSIVRIGFFTPSVFRGLESSKYISRATPQRRNLNSLSTLLPLPPL
jgi:hypothetical protein